MNELIAAWTRAGLAVAAYFEGSVKRAEVIIPTRVVDAPAPSLAADVPAKPRKPRAVKEEAAPTPAAAAAAPMPEGLEAPPAPPAIPPAAPVAEGEIPEGKSLAALYEVGAKVVERFKNSKPTGFERATAHMTTTYKVARMQDLPHAQRLQFIGWLKTELEKAA